MLYSVLRMYSDFTDYIIMDINMEDIVRSAKKNSTQGLIVERRTLHILCAVYFCVALCICSYQNLFRKKTRQKLFFEIITTLKPSQTDKVGHS